MSIEIEVGQKHVSIGDKLVKTTGIISASILIIGSCIAVWVSADEYFAHSSDITIIKQDIQSSEWNFEQAQNAIRIDVIEDRIYREEQRSTPDTTQIRKWDKQINRLEQRNTAIQKNKDLLELEKIKNKSE